MVDNRPTDISRSHGRDMSALQGLNILLGVSGGIAAYKSPDLVRRLRERGAEVQVVMTQGAQQFVTATTFQAVSGRAVRAELWDPAAEAAMGHIELARWADLVLIAPATADLLARVAAGRADDLLTTLLLATAAPVAVAPAMNSLMWAKPATQDNVNALRTRGVLVIGPGHGSQACGETGDGRMSEPLEIVAAIEAYLAQAPDADAHGGGDTDASDRSRAPTDGPLSGCKVVITAGPTREAIDPVRYITNRSSGKMGFAIAEAARAAGAEVTLIAGPVQLASPPGVARIDVLTAAQMHDAVMAVIEDTQIFIGTAAVADYRPIHIAPRKIKKSGERLDIELERTVDILASVAACQNKPFTVGFAAETHDVESYARDKLERKSLDMIAANEVGDDRGFDCDDNALLVLWPGEGRASLPSASKTQLAAQLVKLIAERMPRSL
jgi:phosphopantothenoylcysteine decarboxylase/phosphopantothenate--cysteine ligase